MGTNTGTHQVLERDRFIGGRYAARGSRLRIGFELILPDLHVDKLRYHLGLKQCDRLKLLVVDAQFQGDHPGRLSPKASSAPPPAA